MLNWKRYLKKVIPRSWLDSRHWLYAWYGAFKYGHPSREMTLVAVTGTSGKSSVIHFLRQVLMANGKKVGSLSTIEFCLGEECRLNDQKMTMLGRTKIQEYLREMKNNGCEIAIVEVTSEGFLQHRHRFIDFDMVALTNLYPEHLEAHGGLANYKKAKLGIFQAVSGTDGKNKTAVINGDSEYCRGFGRLSFANKYYFSRGDKKSYCLGDQNSQTIVAREIKIDEEGLNFFIGETEFHPRLYVDHQLDNLLVVISLARALDLTWSEIQNGVNQVKDPPGRIEFIPEAEKRGFQVIVDYAFEPIALEALYKVVRRLQPNRIIQVAGATGGGRDHSRRQKNGQLMGNQADLIIITDEDPYDDDPLSIMQAVAEGVEKAGKKKNKNYFIIPDRRQAIERAIELAKTGDLVLVTGKGSEQAICVARGRKIPWDDREEVRRAIAKKYGN